MIQLETQLGERTNYLTEALKEGSRYKLKTVTLARRVDDLERILTRVRNEADRDRHGHIPCSTAASSSVAPAVGGTAAAERVKDEFEEKFQATEKGRDSAKELVSEVKKLTHEAKVFVRRFESCTTILSTVLNNIERLNLGERGRVAQKKLRQRNIE